MKFVSCERSRFILLAAEYPEHLSVSQESEVLGGYQLYVVEQWISDRSRFYNSVVAYTGDANDQIKCCVVELSQSKWGLFEKLLESLEAEKSKQMETRLGTIMVFNLPSFPSHLNLIHIADGDYEAHLLKLQLSLNMKRLGCSGRSALTIKEPSHAQREKFYQLFRMNEKFPLEQAAFELIILFQISLYFLGYFPATYCDGVFCDNSLIALQQFGNHYNLQINNSPNPSNSNVSGSSSNLLPNSNLLSVNNQVSNPSLQTAPGSNSNINNNNSGSNLNLSNSMLNVHSSSLHSLSDSRFGSGHFTIQQGGEFVVTLPLLTVLMSKVLELCNKMAFLGYQVPKDPFSAQEQMADIISLWQSSIGLEATGYFDKNSIVLIDQVVKKTVNSFSLKPKVFKKKLEDLPVDMECTEIDVLIKVSKNARLKYLWKGTSSKFQDMVENPTSLAGNLIQGSKEIGKTILRGVGKSPSQNIEKKTRKEAKKLQEEQQLMRHPRLRHNRNTSLLDSAALAQTNIFHETSRNLAIEQRNNNANNLMVPNENPIESFTEEEEGRLTYSLSEDSDVNNANEDSHYGRSVSPPGPGSMEDVRAFGSGAISPNHGNNAGRMYHHSHANNSTATTAAKDRENHHYGPMPSVSPLSFGSGERSPQSDAPSTAIMMSQSLGISAPSLPFHQKQTKQTTTTTSPKGNYYNRLTRENLVIVNRRSKSCHELVSLFNRYGSVSDGYEDEQESDEEEETLGVRRKWHRSHSTSQFWETKKFQQYVANLGSGKSGALLAENSIKYNDRIRVLERRLKRSMTTLKHGSNVLKRAKEALLASAKSKRDDISVQERKLLSIMDAQARMSSLIEGRLMSESARLQYELVVQEDKLRELDDAIEELSSRMAQFPGLLQRLQEAKRVRGGSSSQMRKRSSLNGGKASNSLRIVTNGSNEATESINSSITDNNTPISLDSNNTQSNNTQSNNNNNFNSNGDSEQLSSPTEPSSSTSESPLSSPLSNLYFSLGGGGGGSGVDGGGVDGRGSAANSGEYNNNASSDRSNQGRSGNHWIWSLLSLLLGILYILLIKLPITLCQWALKKLDEYHQQRQSTYNRNKNNNSNSSRRGKRNRH